jgi:glycosyltransferase involved in cell wall biosynthesis
VYQLRDERKLRIAMVGQRGVPATYGGIERHVEEVGARLAERGHEVEVYCRSSYAEFPIGTYRDMRLRVHAAPSIRGFEAASHSFKSSFLTMKHPPDIVHYHAIGPGLAAPVARYLSRAGVVQTIHGLDADRDKWGWAARRILRTGEWLSARVPHATIVVAKDLARHYAAKHGRYVDVITNGVQEAVVRPASRITERWGLRAGSYVLAVGRFVPEKRADLLLKAWGRVESNLKLVVAGGSSHTPNYARWLENEAEKDSRVLLPGYVYGDELEELYSNAACFVQASDLEGLPLTVLEAQSYGLPVLLSDIAPHREILEFDQPGGRLFRPGDPHDLARRLSELLTAISDEADAALNLGRQMMKSHSWDEVVDLTEQVYQRVAARPSRPGAQSTPDGSVGGPRASGSY